MTCKGCGSEVIRVVAKKRRGLCHECWKSSQQERVRRHNPRFKLESEEDLLNAAFASAPKMLRWLRISLPSFLVRRKLEQDYHKFAQRLEPGDRVLPFHFNKWTLAMRKGFLIVRDGKPHDVWITEMS